MINVGTIPENFSFTDVYTFHVDELPSLLVARRASADELIWDAEGGFTDQWNDRSSYEVGDGGGYDFHIARRSFSVAGLPIFAAGSGGGGGGAPTGPAGGDLDGTYPNPTLSSTKTASLLTSAGSAADAGDVTTLAAAEAYTDAAIAGLPTDDSTLDGVTADLTGHADGQVLGFVAGQIVPVSQTGGGSPTAQVYQGKAGNNADAWSWTATTWAGMLTALTGTFTDVLTQGITRSGSTFTFTKSGYYQVSAIGRYYASGTASFMAVRLRRGSTTLLSWTGYTGAGTAVTMVPLVGIIQVTAGDAITFQYVRDGSATISSTNPGSLDGEPQTTLNISFAFVGS